MCVTFICLHSQRFPKSRYKLIVLNNRDEEFSRPTSKLSWLDGILAGRDQEAKEKGTWFGVNKNGRVGVLLSITESHPLHLAAPSRGLIVPEFLKSGSSLSRYFPDMSSRAKNFNGFQFLGIERNSTGMFEMASLTNRLVPEVEPVYWPSGEYGFGNSPQSHPFRKVVHGKQLFIELLEKLDLEKCDETTLIDELLKVATDRTLLFPDEQIRLQNGATEPEDYKYLCSLFVRSSTKRYGTRSHSIFLVDQEDNATFYEKRMVDFTQTDVNSDQWETTVERFKIE